MLALLAASALAIPWDAPSLPGHAVGILVGDPYDVLTSYGISGVVNDVGFCTAGHEYQHFYVEVPDDGVVSNYSVIREMRHRTASGKEWISPAIKPATADLVGVKGDFHLVELTVNRGMGSRESDDFVAADVKVLDGTAEYPIVPGRVVSKLRRAFEEALPAHLGVLQDAMALAWKKETGYVTDGPVSWPEPKTFVYVTWHPVEQQMEVRLVARIDEWLPPAHVTADYIVTSWVDKTGALIRTEDPRIAASHDGYHPWSPSGEPISDPPF